MSNFFNREGEREIEREKKKRELEIGGAERERDRKNQYLLSGRNFKVQCGVGELGILILVLVLG